MFKKSKNYLLVDVNNLFYVTLFAMRKNEREEDIFDQVFEDGVIKFNLKDSAFDNQFKNYFWNTLLGVVTKFNNIYQVILCYDNHSWRNELFPFYKKRRSLTKKQDNFNWKHFFAKIRKFQAEELDKYGPFISMNVERAEGDDIIGVLAIGLAQQYPNSTIYIYSADKDFVQLLKYNNIKLYSPMKKKFIQCLNPKNELLAMILLGDPADGIPNVRNSSDHYVKLIEINGNEKTRKGAKLGEATVWKAITENKVFENIINTPETQKRFQENKTLIDLEMIPIDVQKAIIEHYKQQLQLLKQKSPADIQRYFIMNGMRSLAQSCYKLLPLFNNE